jgi:peptidoglycan/LPS O-acetylase OafA/YrhL
VIRERALKIVMVLVGLLYAAAIYPIVMALRHPAPADDTGDTMMMSLYFTLGVFLLLAARRPSAHRGIIAFTAWSNFAHAVVMTILGFYIPEQKSGFIAASAILVVIGVVLLALAGSNRPDATPTGSQTNLLTPGQSRNRTLRDSPVSNFPLRRSPGI